MKSLEMAASALLLTTALACGSSSSGTSDYGNDDPEAGPLDDGATAQTCNSLSVVGQPIGIRYVAGNAPTPQGGPISDGTYVVTDATVYTGRGSPLGSSGAVQMTLRVAGASAQIGRVLKDKDDDKDRSPEHVNATLVATGTTLTTTDTCPDTNTQKVGYTATSTSIVVILTANGLSDGGTSTLVETFTKQ